MWVWLAEYMTPVYRGNLLLGILLVFVGGCVVGEASIAWWFGRR